MRTCAIGLLFLGIFGCASCQQHASAPAGIPMAGMSAAPANSGGSSEATPAVGIGWETVSFSIPKPKLFAVPKPQQGPQVVGIPILAGGPAMTMAPAGVMAPAGMMAPAAVAQPAVAAAPQQYVPVAPQAMSPQSMQPANTPACDSCSPSPQPGCAEEGCQSQNQAIQQECEALMGEIAELQRQISVQAGGKASVQITE